MSQCPPLLNMPLGQTIQRSPLLPLNAIYIMLNAPSFGGDQIIVSEPLEAPMPPWIRHCECIYITSSASDVDDLDIHKQNMLLRSQIFSSQDQCTTPLWQSFGRA